MSEKLTTQSVERDPRELLNEIQTIVSETAETDDERKLAEFLVVAREKWVMRFVEAFDAARQTEKSVTAQAVVESMKRADNSIDALPVYKQFHDRGADINYKPTKEQFQRILNRLGFFDANPKADMKNIVTYNYSHRTTGESMPTNLEGLALTEADPGNSSIYGLPDETELRKIYESAKGSVS